MGCGERWTQRRNSRRNRIRTNATQQRRLLLPRPQLLLVLLGDNGLLPRPPLLFPKENRQRGRLFLVAYDECCTRRLASSHLCVTAASISSRAQQPSEVRRGEQRPNHGFFGLSDFYRPPAAISAEPSGRRTNHHGAMLIGAMFMAAEKRFATIKRVVVVVAIPQDHSII